MTLSPHGSSGEALALQSGVQGSLVQALVGHVATVIGLALLAAVLAAGVGVFYRWYAADRVPEGLAVLVGLSGVAVQRNSHFALEGVIEGQTQMLATTAALLNITVFAAAALSALVGGRLGDRLGISTVALSGATEIDTDVSRLVRTVGRVVTVELPDEIEDIEGYDPVATQVKEKLAGRTLIFPRGITVEELRERLVTRLRTDFGVGKVDVDVTPEGEVAYLALGSREAGIGPTLPPATVAVAVRADPAFAASPGDVVQVWRPEESGPGHVANGELRGTAGDVITLAVDAADVEALDPEARHRLVTLPAEPRADREFAALLRAAEETMDVVTVEAGSDLVGTPVGALDVAVVAVRSPEAGVEPIPPRVRRLAAGGTVYAVARPDRLRRLQTAASAAAGELAAERTGD